MPRVFITGLGFVTSIGNDAATVVCRRARQLHEAKPPLISDQDFADMAVEKTGVAVVPLSVFAEQDPPRHLVRLCFGKKDETIDAGVAAMAKARELAQ